MKHKGVIDLLRMIDTSLTLNMIPKVTSHTIQLQLMITYRLAAHHKPLEQIINKQDTGTWLTLQEWSKVKSDTTRRSVTYDSL